MPFRAIHYEYIAELNVSGLTTTENLRAHQQNRKLLDAEATLLQTDRCDLGQS